MRWDFRLEEAPGATVHDQATLLHACTAFLRQELAEQRWTYWVAQQGTPIVSHIYIQRVPKVPKPNRLDDALGYVTNVYTRPAYRGQGIGTRLIAHVLEWAREHDLVWHQPTTKPAGACHLRSLRGLSRQIKRHDISRRAAAIDRYEYLC